MHSRKPTENELKTNVKPQPMKLEENNMGEISTLVLATLFWIQQQKYTSWTKSN